MHRVLAAGDKVYQIDNQSLADLEKDAGMSVTATGKLSADAERTLRSGNESDHCTRPAPRDSARITH